MQVKLAYGKDGMDITVPDQNLVKVLQMKKQSTLADPSVALTKSLLQPIGTAPLYDIAKRKKSACVVICDITRPVPNKTILPPILRTLLAAGIPKDKILILIATGIHRPNLDDELIELVGEDIAENYRVANHYGRDLESHVNIGQMKRGADIWLDKRFVEADFKLLTGFIEPHFMAGFSGGRKLVVPGIASIETMKYLHGPKLLSHPKSREGVLEGNPFHEEAVEVARTVNVDFIVNVVLNEDKQITGIFSGDLEVAHLKGVEFVRNSVTDTVPKPLDIVITTSAGYPLDKTWYQAVKGATAAVPIVKPGGTIILVCECSEGSGSDEFTRMMEEITDYNLFMQSALKGDFFIIDQWQVQKYAKVINKARVVTVSDGLSSKQKDAMHLDWAPSVEKALKDALERHGENAKVAVMPKGPYILSRIQT